MFGFNWRIFGFFSQNSIKENIILTKEIVLISIEILKFEFSCGIIWSQKIVLVEKDLWIPWQCKKRK